MNENSKFNSFIIYKKKTDGADEGLISIIRVNKFDLLTAQLSGLWEI